jgi:hypothetical protein
LLAFAGGACLLGTLLVLGLPLRHELKSVLACLWLVRCLLEIRSQVKALSRIDRIRICPTGSLEALSGNGKVEALILLSGSMVLSRVAWLRFRLDDGLQYGELLIGNPRRDEQWRRLQLIWRQRAAAFGGPGGS